MKKIITLMMAAGSFIALHAQTSKDDARKVVLGQPKDAGSSSTHDRNIVLGSGGNHESKPGYPKATPSDKQSRIDQVNREYDAKVISIRNNRTLTEAEKERMIRDLEQDRARRISEIDKDCGKEKKKHADNGKHKGWTKGKGNKHD